MSAVSTTSVGSNLGTALQQLLLCEEIVPGAAPSYETCKVIYLYHPLGQKIAESPIHMAQSMPREISVPDGPEEDCAKAFTDQWDADNVDNTICNVGTQARVYGIASFALLVENTRADEPLDLKALADKELSFNVLDPLNTAGSLVLSQDPNAMDFQKHRDIAVNGVRYHRSRTVTLMNENPIYIAYTTSSFGFVGRSVYQRALFPLKSFVQTMIADDMVARKVGLLVAMIKQAGSISDALMAFAAGIKRALLKIGSNDQVISIGIEDKIESLNLTNLEGPLVAARKDILENVATAVPMPAKLINNETFAEGFGEGTEDAKHVAEYINDIRKWLRPVYVFMDAVTQRRAWNPRWYAALQKKYPDQYKDMDYETAFYRFQNSFTATWPSLLQEPESEQVKVEEVKFKTIMGLAEVFLPGMDPVNAKIVYQFVADNLNATKYMFTSPLQLDWDELEKELEKRAAAAPEPGDGDEGEESPETGLKPPKPPKPAADASNVIEMVNSTASKIAGIEDFLRRNGRGIAAMARRVR